MQYAIGLIAKPLGILLSAIYGAVNNYGVALIILTVIVRGCLYPLYASQVKSTTAMAGLQPKIKEIQTKYANDKEMMNVKMMELYKEEKFNPAGGCLPMLIQMPIIFGLFELLRHPLNYLSDDMILAIHESFLWIKDMSHSDMWILPIAAGIAQFISFTQTQAQQQDMSAQNQQMSSMMNVMKYVFPVSIVLMGRTFPAGLTLYWFFGTLVQIGLNFRLNKIRRDLKAKAKKTKGK